MASKNSSLPIALAVCAVATFVFTYSLRRKCLSKEILKDTEFVPNSITSREIDKVLELEKLAELVRTASFPLGGRVIRVLLKRATRRKNFEHIINCVRQHEDQALRLKATVVLQVMAKLEDHRLRLIQYQLPSLFCKILVEETNEMILKEGIIVLYDLVANQDELKLELVRHHQLLTGLKRALTTIKNRDLGTWAVLLIHNLAITESTQKEILQESFVPLIGKALRLSFGTSTLQKLCFHALVRLISGLEKEQSQMQLESLGPYNIIGLVTNSVKQDDTELVYWALGLLHEFAVKDVFREGFRNIPPLLPALISLFSNPEPSFIKVLLRILKFLGLRNVDFQRRLIQRNAVPKIMNCFALGDEDCLYWALTLIHDLVSHPEATLAILENPNLSYLLDFPSSQMVATVPFYLVDIISYLCSSSTSTEEAISKTNLCASIIKFLKSDDHELVSSALASFFNLALLSPALMDEFINMNAIEVLSQVFLYSGRSRTELMCTKLFCIMISFRPDLMPQICNLALGPFILGVFIENCYNLINTLTATTSSRLVESSDLSAEPSSSSSSSSSVSTTPLLLENVFQNESNLDHEVKPEEDEKENELQEYYNEKDPATLNSSLSQLFLNQYTDRLDSAIQCISFFSMYPTLFRTLIMEHSDILEIFIDALFDLMTLPIVEDGSQSNPNEKRDETEAPSATALPFLEIRLRFSSAAIQCLSCLIEVEPILYYLNAERFATALVTCYQENTDLMETCLGAMARLLFQANPEELLSVPFFLYCAWKAIYVATTPLSAFYAKLIMDFIVLDSPGSMSNLDAEATTPHLMMSNDGTEIWNTTWAFESARGANGVTQNGKFKYEVECLSDGLIQVGWATEDCLFEMACGRGVGDDDYSYAYDGMRERKWHGFKVHFEGWSYGEKWQKGDIVECLLDLDQKTTSFTLNGKDLGTAFENVNTFLTWYPALSIASGQGCKLNFGNRGNPFRIENLIYQSIPTKKEILPSTPVESSLISEESGFYTPTSVLSTSPDSPQTSTSSTPHDDTVSPLSNLPVLPLDIDLMDVLFYLEIEVFSDGQLGLTSPEHEIYISFYPLQIHNGNVVHAFPDAPKVYGTMGIGCAHTMEGVYSVFFSIHTEIFLHLSLEVTRDHRPFFSGSGGYINWGEQEFKCSMLQYNEALMESASAYLDKTFLLHDPSL